MSGSSSKSSTEESQEYIRVGRILKPHGIDGELVVDPSTGFPDERFNHGDVLMVADDMEISRSITCEAYRWHQDRILLNCQDIDDRDEAETLRNKWLMVPVEDRLESDDYILGNDLVGLDVHSKNGDYRGNVAAVHPDSMNPLIKIELDDESYEFPLSETLIDQVDHDRGRLILEFPEGWKKLVES